MQSRQNHNGFMHVHVQGFIQRRGGGPWNSPPPEILKLSMVIIVLSQVLNNNLVPDCIRSNLRGPKFKIFLGEHASDHPSRHAHLHVYMSVLLHTTIILLPSRSPPPPQLKILYETLMYTQYTHYNMHCNIEIYISNICIYMHTPAQRDAFEESLYLLTFE